MTPRYWRLRLANGPLWRGSVIISWGAIAERNIQCAECGQRSYQCAVNVRSRTSNQESK